MDINNGAGMSQFILWTDIETGGFDEYNGEMLGMESYPILELAFVLTDCQLNVVSQFRIVIRQPDFVLKNMHEWAIKTHTESGLIAEVRASQWSLQQAEHIILDWLKTKGVKPYDRESKTGAVMAGSSIKLDRNFIMCQMPKLHKFLHYRQLDLSAMALAARFWCPELEKKAVNHKQYSHKALEDIHESIAEAKVYQRFLGGVCCEPS